MSNKMPVKMSLPDGKTRKRIVEASGGYVSEPTNIGK